MSRPGTREAQQQARQQVAAEAQESLTLALVTLASRGGRPRCGDPVTHDYWLSEDPKEREIAADWCNGCPVFTPCGVAAEAAKERFGVWAGVDRTVTQRMKGKAA